MSSWTVVRIIRRICRKELEFVFKEHRDYTMRIIYTQIVTHRISEWRQLSPLAKTAVYNSFHLLRQIVEITLTYIIDQTIGPVVMAKYTSKAIDMKLEQSIIEKDIEDTFRAAMNDYFSTSNVIENAKELSRELYARNENEMWNNCYKSLSYSINTQIHDCFVAAKDRYARVIAGYITRSVRNVDVPIYQIIKEHTNGFFWQQRNAAVMKISNFINYSIREVITNSIQALPENIDRDAVLARIEGLIRRKMYVEALEVALAGTDVTIIEHVCQRVQPQAIFTVRVSRIPHHLIIKLVRELGMSLRTDTALKITYLLKAFKHLNFKELASREYVLYALKHIPRTAEELLRENPPRELAINLTKILKRSQTLLKVCCR